MTTMTIEQAKRILQMRCDSLTHAIIALDSLTSYEGAGVSVKVKRTVSPQARRKMAAAQKRRWAAYRANKKAGGKL